MRLAVAVVCGLIAGGARASAQDAPIPLTLDEAVARGVESSHRIAEGDARAAAAAATADARRAIALPQIAAQAGYTRTNHVEQFGVPVPDNPLRVIYPDIPDNYRTRLDAQWLLWDGGRARELERAARTDASASAAEVAVVRADLKLEIARAYWRLVTASESLRVVDQSVVRVEAHLRDVQNQLAAGLIAPNDVLAVEAQRSRQRMLSIQAASARTVAEAALARLVGLPPGSRVNAVSPPNASAIGARDWSVLAIFDEARQRSPERAVLLERIQAAESRERAAVLARQPMVGVGGGFDYARPNPRVFPREDRWRESWDASINLNWPIFDGGRARAEQAETTQATRALRERLAELDSLLSLEAHQRLSELESSRAAIGAAEDAVRAATEARRVAGERFAAGVATSTDLLDAQVVVLQAELDRTSALANARLAEAAVLRTVGR
jgi:outer membrane protein TolC